MDAIISDLFAALSLTSGDGGWSATAHALATGLVLATIAWFNNKHSKQERKKELNGWIARARQEKASKEHNVILSERFDENAPILSAKETRDRVLAKKLDLKENLAFLSKRCHNLNLDWDGVNAVAEEFYDEAYEIASNLDVVDANSTTAPPLFGVPISVKECIAVKGKYSTGGLACRLNHKMEKDSLTVELLRKAGAIPMCTGNTIQIMMLCESVNRIWGRSRNPWNLTRTPGGSSGGDAALVAMGCVPLAAASDVAGSIRIPACFCGVVGFKPTSTRLSGRGSMKPRKNNKAGTSIAIPAANGPLARTVEDCALFMKAVCTPGLFAGDLNVPKLPFDEKAYQDKSKLKIGYFKTDDWFEPCVTSKRALETTLAALTKAGHNCVPFEAPTNGWHNYQLLVGINAAEGNFKSFLEALEGEDVIDEYAPLIQASSIPNWLRWVLCKVLDKRRAHLLGSSRDGGVSVYELWQRTANLLALRTQWSDAFRESGIDALVYPGFPIPALPHGISGDLTASVSYMFLPNLLLWPAGAVPITTVRSDEQHYRIEDLPPDQRDKAARITADLVMKDSEGLPISVSVMTPAFEDEKCLRVMKEIERLVDFKETPCAYKSS